jgi:hypothetical protein
MKAVEFMLAHAEMCKYYGGVIKGCKKNGEQCPLHDIDCDLSPNMSPSDAEIMQVRVEKWLNRNAETNGAHFERTFGIDILDLYNLSSIDVDTWRGQKYEKI